MTITLTITGDSSEINTYFYPPITLDEKYECGLLYFSTFNSIPNITKNNNSLICGDEKIEIPYGMYSLEDINDYLANLKTCKIELISNNNTLTCSVFCNKDINFNIENSIAPLLGFPKTILKANKRHTSSDPVHILPVTLIRIECDLVQGSFTNGKPSHVLYEFVPNVPPGYQFIEAPKQILYYPIQKKYLSSVKIRLTDLEGKTIDFQNEKIHLSLHLRKSK